MPYRATTIDVDLPQGIILEKVDYPENPAEQLLQSQKKKCIKSKLLLLSKDEGPASSYSKFYKFCVIVQQKCEGDDEIVSYLLFESNRIYKTRGDIFLTIKYTLAPLLSTGQARLSEALLKAVILPEPVKPKEICDHLVGLMEQDPEGNPEWHSLIQVLLTNKDVHLSPPNLKGEVTSFKQENSPELMKQKMRVTGTIGSYVVPVVATPQVALNMLVSPDSDETTSRKIYHLARKGTIVFRNRVSVHSLTKTWLMDAVQNEYVQSCMFLLLSGVNPNDLHPSSGDTALHFAVRQKSTILVKLLLACQADPMITNNNDETPLDAAKKLTGENAGAIVSVLKEFHSLQRQAYSYYKENSHLPKKKNTSKVFLLSLDGGGVRGFITCLIMARIEKRMKELYPDCEPFQSYFDYVAGTSAGAAIGSIMVYTHESVQNSAVLMYKFVNEVFKKTAEERPACLKHYIVENVGESTVMSDLEHQNIIITAAKADVSPNKLHLMTNYGKPRDGKAGPNERKLWEALVASASAPSYFPPFENSLMDGGIMANNPTIPAMVDIFDRKDAEQLDLELGFVLSLGTGMVPPKKVHNIDVYAPHYSLSSLVHSAIGLKNLFIHFMDQATHSDGEVVHQAEVWCKSIGATFHRMSPLLKKEISLDTTDLPDLVDLLCDTEAYLLRKHIIVDTIAKRLLSK